MLEGPAKQAYAINIVTTANAALSPVPRALYIGTGGNVAVIMAHDAEYQANAANGTVVSFINVANGTVLEISVIKIMTSTTANNVVALY